MRSIVHRVVHAANRRSAAVTRHVHTHALAKRRPLLSSWTSRSTGSRAIAIAAAATAAFVLPGVALAATASADAKTTSTAPATTLSASPSSPATSSPTPGTGRVAVDPKVELEHKENVIKHFLAHASLEIDGEKYMSVRDFLKALDTEDSEHVRALFGLVDNDHNKAISLAEYMAFASLLYSDEADLRVAFEIFDADHDGTITLDEFNKGLASLPLSVDNMKLRADSTFATRFFGTPDQPRTLNINEFRQLLDGLNERLIRDDFNSNDAEGNGMLSAQQFVEVLKDKGRGMVPKNVQDNVYRYLSQRENSNISFEEYAAFLHLVNDIDRIESLMEKRAQKGPMKQVEFREILARATGQPLSTDNAGLVFHVFANPVDHTIDPVSFLAVMKARMKGASSHPTMSYMEYIALSGISAMVGATTVFPMDKIKTRLQTSNSNLGIVGQFKEIVAKEGFLKLYRGLGPQLVGITPEKALKLTTNAFFVNQIGKGAELSFGQQVLAGMLTGMVQVTLTTPVEIVKIRLQMQANQAAIKSPLQVIQELGLRGMYTGYSATMLRDVPFNMIFFSVSAWARQHLADEKGNVSSLGVLAASAGAGMMAAALDTPADTIKTRLQAGGNKYTGIVDCVRKTVAEEGLHAFSKGLIPRILIISPLFGITMMTLAKLQEVVRPYHRVPEPSVQEELTALRHARVDQIGTKLRTKYGL